MKELIQKNILRTLRDASGYPLATDILILQVRDRTRPLPKDGDIADALESLAIAGFVLSKPDELDPTAKAWLLSETGEAYVIRKSL